MAATSFARLLEEMRRAPFHKWLRPVARGVYDDRREVVLASPFRTDLSLSRNQPSPTVTLQIDFLRPAIARELLATAVLRQLCCTISRVDVEIGDGNKPFVLGRGTFLTRGSEA